MLLYQMGEAVLRIRLDRLARQVCYISPLSMSVEPLRLALGI